MPGLGEDGPAEDREPNGKRSGAIKVIGHDRGTRYGGPHPPSSIARAKAFPGESKRKREDQKFLV